VRKLSFTGSTRVGKLLAERGASTVKRVSLELGGNAPFILFDDADVDAAVEGVMMAKFRNAGQACVAANRIFVQDGVYDRFITALRARIERLTVGPGLDDGVQIGPLINEAGLAKCEAHVKDALAHGARLTVGGRPHALGGTFFEPGLIENVTPQMALSQEETFGPVAAVMRFADEREVIAMANDTESGLAAYFFTRDNARVWRVSEALEYGMVGVNTGLISTAVAPFGGVKESGLGREGSAYGIDDWVELKYVCVGGVTG
jgi:succinate-semialdehyde dehydrogenase/glutarate-semialdehyde dehydrogenase